MGSISARYDEQTYEFVSVEQKYVSTDVYPGYAFNQATLPKPCFHAHPTQFMPFSDNVYSNWTATDGYYLSDNQMEIYPSGNPYDTTATLYMTGYHAMEYGINTEPQSYPEFLHGFLPDFTTGAYSSPHGGSGVPSYPQTTWSPSEPSVASLSPPYESQWEGKPSAAGVETFLSDAADEVLQGLGLYDCPELATDCSPSGQLYASCPSSGRGLKLEESFEFKEEYSDDEGEDDEDEDESRDED